jgi:hypothetical protein
MFLRAYISNAQDCGSMSKEFLPFNFTLSHFPTLFVITFYIFELLDKYLINICKYANLQIGQLCKLANIALSFELFNNYLNIFD